MPADSDHVDVVEPPQDRHGPPGDAPAALTPAGQQDEEPAAAQAQGTAEDGALIRLQRAAQNSRVTGDPADAQRPPPGRRGWPCPETVPDGASPPGSCGWWRPEAAPGGGSPLGGRGWWWSEMAPGGGSPLGGRGWWWSGMAPSGVMIKSAPG